MEDKRIRLVFKDDDILSETQKSDGLNRSWVLLKPQQHDTVSDVASHLLHGFQLHQSCPHGLLLSRSGFVLPPFESTRILKDNEIIRVRKKRDIVSIAGNNAGNDVEKLKAVEKQPVNSGLLLLASEEFEKEKGGYESDDPEEDDEEDLLQGVENPSCGNADPKKRKRKAAEKLQGSKKKKQRFGASGSVANDVHTETNENSLHDGGLTRKKSVSSKEKKDDSNAEDNVENNEETAKLSDKSPVPVPGMKRNVEVQENGKETEDGEIVSKGTKRVQSSRSARRKSVKRRWLKEMKKIQKQNATCESEGLRNWKEDHAKAERKKVDGQLKGWQKWKKHQADAERAEVDEQPKGLLHLKLSFENNRLDKGKKRQQRNQNCYFIKHPNRNGDVHDQKNQNCDGHEQPTQNDDGLEQPNQKQGDVHEQPGQKSGGIQEHPNQNCDASGQLNEESDEENEVVPIVIRPGHIRFEPLGKGQAVQQNHVPSETFQWNGITSKKKGQQWGKENRSFTPRNDYKNSNKEYSETFSKEKEKQPDEGVNFDKLPPLTSMPKEGDLIAYQILELSSSWTPELSGHRVGKVSWYKAESNQIMLLPVPEYPIVSKKAAAADDDDDDEAVQPDNSLYKEDGSLEIDFSSLIDVRVLKNGSSVPGNEALRQVSEGSVGKENAPKTVLPSSNDKQTVVPSPDTIELSQDKEAQSRTAEIGGVNIWDELGEALNARKEQLSKENGWGKTPKKLQLTYAKKVQPSPASSGGKNAHKVQPSQDNSSGKQSSGGKSWSYKALRGGGLGQTMAILRSRKDI